MKKRHVVIVIVVALLGFWGYRRYEDHKAAGWSFEKGETARITRGNLSIPVPASGTVAPAKRTEIKSKASGKVQRVYFEEGDVVKKGDLLVELDPVDEERNVSNARAEVAAAQANMDIAQSEVYRVISDWPTRMQAALASLETGRAELRRSVVNLRRLELLRQGKDAKEAAFDIVLPETITPEVLMPRDNLRVQKCARQIALAVREAAEVRKQVEKSKAILARAESTYGAAGRSEYQDGVIAAWQAYASLLARCAEVRDSVNLSHLVDQAKIQVTLREKVRDQANLALEQVLQRLDETRVYAPSDGIVQKVLVREGGIISSGITTVTGGTSLMLLADVSDLYIEADVDEADIGRVRKLAPAGRSGQLMNATRNPTNPPTTTTPVVGEHTAEDIALLNTPGQVDITVDAFRDEIFTGRVSRVHPDPKVVNNVVSYGVRILLTSENRHQLMLGMHANVNFATSELKNVLLVDIEAIKVKNDQHGVYVPGDGGQAVFVPVKIGLSGPDKIELRTDKLKEGDTVYIKLPKPREKKESEADEE